LYAGRGSACIGRRRSGLGGVVVASGGLVKSDGGRQLLVVLESLEGVSMQLRKVPACERVELLLVRFGVDLQPRGSDGDGGRGSACIGRRRSGLGGVVVASGGLVKSDGGRPTASLVLESLEGVSMQLRKVPACERVELLLVRFGVLRSCIETPSSDSRTRLAVVLPRKRRRRRARERVRRRSSTRPCPVRKSCPLLWTTTSTLSSLLRLPEKRSQAGTLRSCIETPSSDSRTRLAVVLPRKRRRRREDEAPTFVEPNKELSAAVRFDEAARGNDHPSETPSNPSPP
jgi:hypothetical protein